MAIISKRMLLVAGLMASASLPASLHAQAAPPPPAATAASDSAMVNLVRLLVAQKVLSPKKGAALMAQAQAEADAERQAQAKLQQQAEATRLAAATPPAPPSAGDLPPPPSGTVRVAYVPDTVREAIKQDLRGEVMEQAKAEGWAAKGEAAPEWTRRISISGDLRVRSQYDFYAPTNAPLFDYGAMNQSGPYNIANATGSFPYLDTTRDHLNQLKLRARLGVNIKVADGVDAGIQLASGDDPSPISTNASFGGGLQKRSLWLQQGWLRVKPAEWGSLTIGRMPNPFVYTELLFDDELNFDGVAGQLTFNHLRGSNVDFKLRGGAFPLDFGSPNYLATQSVKEHFPQKWLFSAQAELAAPVSDRLSLRFDAAYYHYSNIQGQLSTPCDLTTATECSTDGSRPMTLGKGNTLSFLRQFATSSSSSQPQYFGLTFNYHLLDANMLVSYDLGNNRFIDLNGDYVRNVGLRFADICRNGFNGEPVNNHAATTDVTATICDAATTRVNWTGGRVGWQTMLRVGNRQPMKWGEWMFEAAYRRVASDAVLASFSDADFHLGGTNAKGYIIGAKAGIFNNMSLGARWYSANQITGDPLAIDVLQVDLNARF